MRHRQVPQILAFECIISLTFRKFFKTSLIFLNGAFLVQESFYPVAEMVLEFVQLGVQVVYGKMVDIAFGGCHSFILLHGRCSSVALDLAKCIKARFRITPAIEATCDDVVRLITCCSNHGI